MNRNSSIAFLIFCFSLSSVNTGLASQTVEISPIIVQPYDTSELRELNQQVLAQDRINRDQELAIKGLVEDDQRLERAAFIEKEDTSLDKVDRTMNNYLEYLLSRDRARIWGNSRTVSKYDDLIKLTEYVDGMRGVGQTLEEKKSAIEEKYKILNDLKHEMMALNDKLKNQTSPGKPFQVDQDQEAKFRLLTQSLREMDQKIARFDDVLALKDKQIAELKDDLTKVQNESAIKDNLIKSQKDQLAELQGRGTPMAVPTNNTAIPAGVQPATGESKDLAAKDEIIKQKQGQVDLLKSELEDKITVLKAQSQELADQEGLMRSQADQVAGASEKLNDQGAGYSAVKSQIMDLRNKVQQQADDLKARDESIRWLNQVMSVAKNKAEYYRLTSQQDQLSLKGIREQVEDIKEDFAKRFKDYDQFEKAIISLKDQVGQLGQQLSQKQNQVDLLKSQNQQDIQVQQDLKAKLQQSQAQIQKMKADIQGILQAQADKEIYRRQASAKIDDRIQLAKELIDLEQQETGLLKEKNDLSLAQNAKFEDRAMELEKKIKGLLAVHRLQQEDWQNRMQELQDELSQKEEQVESLTTELKNKINEEENQAVLLDQIQDFKSRLQDKENQIAGMKARINEAQKSAEETDALKQQLAAAQEKAYLLKQQLDSKTELSDKMGMMLGDYQKKLEAKNNAYNMQFGKMLSSKNNNVQMDQEVAELNARLQEKEAQVIKIKRDMYEMQELVNAKDREVQAKDLDLSMIQQKMTDQKINGLQDSINGLRATNVRQLEEITNLRTALAMAREELKGMPSSDELDFMRTGLKKAVAELKQKSDMLVQTKANADEYLKEFNEQSREFQSLKDQLQEAQDKIKRDDEDLKYKDLEVARFKYLMGKSHGNNQHVDLQVELKNAERKIRDLQAQLRLFKSPHKKDILELKLQQALDKIDQQGQMINALAQKLQDCGKSVDLTKVAK